MARTTWTRVHSENILKNVNRNYAPCFLEGGYKITNIGTCDIHQDFVNGEVYI